MNYELKSQDLNLVVNETGAQPVSLKYRGRELLWQGEGTVWPYSALKMFPFAALLYQGEYSYRGTRYHMPVHGFAKDSQFVCEQIEENAVTLSLRADRQTKEWYPFDFSLNIKYTLSSSSVLSEMRVCNCGGEEMFFCCGTHPAFFLTDSMDQYYIEFKESCRPQRLMPSENRLWNGTTQSYDLEDGKYLKLGNSLFDAGAIVLKNAADQLILKSRKGDLAIQLKYPRGSCLGLWTPSQEKCDFICIECYTSPSGIDGITEDFETKKGLIRLLPEEVFCYAWEVCVLEQDKV